MASARRRGIKIMTFAMFMPHDFIIVGNGPEKKPYDPLGAKSVGLSMHIRRLAPTHACAVTNSNAYACSHTQTRPLPVDGDGA